MFCWITPWDADRLEESPCSEVTAPLRHTTKVLIYLKTTCQQPQELGSRYLSRRYVPTLSLIPSMAKLRDKVSQTLCGVQSDCPETVVNNKIQYRWRSEGTVAQHKLIQKLHTLQQIVTVFVRWEPNAGVERAWKEVLCFLLQPSMPTSCEVCHMAVKFSELSIVKNSAAPPRTA